MRNARSLHWALPVALLCSCSSELPSHNSSIGLLPDVASQATAVLAGHTDKVWHAAFSPDGSRIVTVADSADHTVRLWDTGGKQLAVLAGHTDMVRSAAFSPDGSRIVTASVDSTARLWDIAGKPLAAGRWSAA